VSQQLHVHADIAQRADSSLSLHIVCTDHLIEKELNIGIVAADLRQVALRLLAKQAVTCDGGEDGMSKGH
jgi:exopolysaccharide biosynthesis protein